MHDLRREEQLADAIARALALNNTGRFREYWELYKQTAEVSEVEDLFFRIEEEAGYCNMVILGDERIADIEGDDGHSSGSLRVYPLSSVSEVILHRGSLPSLRRSQGARLVVLLNLTGQDGAGPYWTALTSEEEHQLTGFARSVIRSISGR